MKFTKQIELHVKCLVHGNIFKPAKAWFHLKGIGRALSLALV